MADDSHECVFVKGKDNQFPQGYDQTKFSGLEIDSNVHYIPYMACYAWDNLKVVDLQKNGSNLKSIEQMAFCECQQLTTFKCGPGLQIIANDSFRQCGQLKTIHWNDEIQEIGAQAFKMCRGMEELDMSVLKNLFTISRSCFRYCKGLRTMILPPKLKKIEQSAFSDCEALQQITWNSAQLTEIGMLAFTCCSSLVELDLSIILQLTTIGTCSFAFCSSLETVRLPASLKTIGVSAFHQCTSLKDIQFNDGLEEIGCRAFEKFISLKEVALPPRLVHLQRRTFYMGSSLETVVLPVGLASIGTAAFGECIALSHVPLPNGLSEDQIGANAFYMCHKLAGKRDRDYWWTNGTEETDEDWNYPTDATKLMIPLSYQWCIATLPCNDCIFESIDMQGHDLKKAIRLKNLCPYTTPRLSMNRLVAMYAKSPMTEADFEVAALNDPTARQWDSLKGKDLEKLKEIELAYASSIFKLVHWCCGIGLLEDGGDGRKIDSST